MLAVLMLRICQDSDADEIIEHNNSFSGSKDKVMWSVQDIVFLLWIDTEKYYL